MQLPVAVLLAGMLALVPGASASESAQVSKGRAIYTEHCQKCHGSDGQRGEGFQTPIWGSGAQIKKFENAQVLFEYLQLLMPFDDPRKIDDQARWDVMAYMLQHHKAIAPTDTIDPANATAVPIR